MRSVQAASLAILLLGLGLVACAPRAPSSAPTAPAAPDRAGGAAPPSAPASPTLTTAAAMAAYDAGDFAECARIFGALATDMPRNIRRQRRYQQACCLTRAGAIDDAFQVLGLAVDEGLQKSYVETDTDFTAAHADPRWPRLLAALDQAEAERRKALTHPALHDELLARAEVDQAAVMKAFVDEATKGDPALAAAAAATTRDNTAWLRRVVAEHGWPTHAMVGEDGAHSAWLLVQHADADPAFQAECLAKMEPLLRSEQASEVDYAYLYDRVAVAEHRPQRYGTQFDEHRQPRPIEEPDGVDARRARIGLPTMAEYTQQMIKMYGPPPPR
ncbi:MAG: DUF6624 domain-containing protein [Kofleriaceae bacterium]